MIEDSELLLAADRQIHENRHGKGTLFRNLPFLTEDVSDGNRARHQTEVIRHVGFTEALHDRFAEVHYGSRDLIVILRDGEPVLTIHKTWQGNCHNAETMRPRSPENDEQQ